MKQTFLALALILLCPSLLSGGLSVRAAAPPETGAIVMSPSASTGAFRFGDRHISPGDFQDGDLIFQPSALSSQSLAIQLATKSPYSHCGIVFSRNGRVFVFEALRTVSWTPLEEWIRRGVNGHYVLMRLKNRDALLTPEAIAALQRTAEDFVGKAYDPLFQWTDDTMYCSELVWKIYHRALGIELAALRKIRDYDLNHEEVQKKVKERFGLDIPWNATVIAPSDVMAGEVLKRVGEGGNWSQ